MASQRVEVDRTMTLVTIGPETYESARFSYRNDLVIVKKAFEIFDSPRPTMRSDNRTPGISSYVMKRRRI